MIAFVQAHRAGLWHHQHWLPNIFAGLMVSVVALPLAVAFAIASGAQPEQGLYTAIIASLIVSIFGGSRLQIAGPSGAFIVVLSSVTAEFGITGLQLASMMAGFMLMLFGFLRLGRLIKFIPTSVILGFTCGIATIIWIGECPDFLGLPPGIGSNEPVYQKVWHLLMALPQLHLPTTLLAILCMLLTLFVHHIPKCKRVPGPLIALIVGTWIQSQWQIPGIATIGSVFGQLPAELPKWQLPNTTWQNIIMLIGPALSIALLCAIESLLSAMVADRMAGTAHDANQELIGQGLANILSPMFGGFAASGAISRTATNVRNGATGPLAGITQAVTLAVILFFLAPLAAHIPLATLAAILFVVAWHMFDLKLLFFKLRCAPFGDNSVLIVTFFLTVFFDLIIAVTAGSLLSWAFHRSAPKTTCNQRDF
jgi:SulP family sulfate permease